MVVEARFLNYLAVWTNPFAVLTRGATPKLPSLNQIVLCEVSG